MKLNEARRALTARLAAVTDEAALEADLIMEYATGRKKAVILFSDAELLPREAEAIDAAARRREAHEPLQYIPAQEHWKECHKCREDVPESNEKDDEHQQGGYPLSGIEIVMYNLHHVAAVIERFQNQ